MAAAVLAVTAVAGAAISAYGAVRQGQQAKEASDYNNNLAQTTAEKNAQIEEANAAESKRKAEYDAETSSTQFKQLLGKQKALYAKAGVDISSGSPLLMMSFQAEQAERDRQAILYEGKTAAESATTRAGLFRLGKNTFSSDADTAGYISGASTFLSGLGSAYTGYKSSTTVTK